LGLLRHSSKQNRFDFRIKGKSKRRRADNDLPWPRSLIVGQVCLSLVLLTAAGLFARSLMKLQEAEVGFNRDNVLLVGIDPRLAGYKPSQLSAFYQQVLSRVIAWPGVVASTVASYAPMGAPRP